MSLYFTKADLYSNVERFRNFFGLTTFPINFIAFLKQFSGIKIEATPFESRALRGVLSFGDDTTDDIVLLNSNRTEIEQNFDCAHEGIHLAFHRHENRQSFQCVDIVSDKQNTYLEWHANEGAAQLLVPYQDFIPRFVELLNSTSQYPEMWIQGILAGHYGVTSQVICNRLNSLGYEIDQYRIGVPISSLEILSNRQQSQRGIHPTCYNAVCDFSLNWDSQIG